MILEDKISTLVPVWRKRVGELVKEHGSFKIASVTVEQIYGGIRGVPIQVSDISYVDPQEGIRLRGYSIPEVLEALPKWDGSEYPMVGGLYYLLMANALPTKQQALEVEREWKARSEIPGYVYNVLRAMPTNTHPMVLFSQGILIMQNDSVFARKYEEGVPKDEYWRYYLEDSMNLTARLPGLAAFIYNLKYRDGQIIPPNPDLDWGANFAYMIGKGGDKEYEDLCRLFFVIHSDHEGANVSAHTAHLVASALSDIYYAVSAGMDGLAGPLHGLANQEVLFWLLDLQKRFPDFPTREELADFAWKQLQAGQVIPGYGHAVLRTTDPRFTAQLNFGKEHLPKDELFQLVNLVYDTVPGVLKRLGKVSNPWPNVDAISGTLQYYYGLRQPDFFTVLFGVSRSLGITTHATWARVLMKPIERPKSMTTKMLEDMIEAQEAKNVPQQHFVKTL